MIIKAISTFFAFITISLCCCFAAELVPVHVEDPVEIVGGYSIGKPALSGLKLYGPSYNCEGDRCYPTVVEPNVVEIGWNDELIVVEQYYRDTGIFSTPDAANPKWFVIFVASHQVYYDMSNKEFLELKEKLGIPELRMLKAVEVYEQGSRH